MVHLDTGSELVSIGREQVDVIGDHATHLESLVFRLLDVWNK